MSAPEARNSRAVLALKPLSAPTNSFAADFAEHIDGARFHKVGFDWAELGRGAYDVVLFHWPTEFFRPTSRKATTALLAKMALDRARHGTRFVWLVHNLEPHDGGSVRSPAAAHAFTALLDGAIYLSATSRQAARRRYPGLRRGRDLTTVHGVYRPVTSPPTAPPGARKLLFFGHLRRYKNVPHLVRTMRAVKDPDTTLTIVGVSEDEALTAEIHGASDGDPRISLRILSEPLPQSELEAVIDAHDGVLLPYNQVLNSGVALHALARHRPILAPAVGSLPELAADVGPWATLFEGELTPRHLEAFAARLAALPEQGPPLSRYEWTRVGHDVTRFLAQLALAPRRQSVTPRALENPTAPGKGR